MLKKTVLAPVCIKSSTIPRSSQNKFNSFRTTPTERVGIAAALFTNIWHVKEEKKKAVPVTGREGPEGCETSRLPHFLDNRLTDGR
jgi:hypothetical protein